MTVDQPPLQTRCLAFGEAAVGEAVRAILAGEPVALPSETVYGLAADATNARAVAAIYAAKGRPSFNPLIVHVADRAMAEAVADFPAAALVLADAFWPGPLTLVLPRRGGGPVCDLATAGLPTVAVRMPAHSAMRAVIAACGRPLAAPSANRSGAISPASLGGRIGLVVDAGPTSQGIESTIVAVGAEGVRILRHGPITAEQLAATGVKIVSGGGKGIEAPGQLASHYCPDKLLRLEAEVAAEGEFLIGFGSMACDYNLSEAGDLVEAAANLFAALHLADASEARAIAVAPVPRGGIGEAINDRLARAAVR
jgi:L-threonylcarbamoyladenylate synthase